MTTLLPGNILYSGPTTFLENLNCDSLGQFVLQKLKEFSNKTLLIDAVTEREYTGQTLYDYSVRLACAFESLGIKKGDIVGISSENRFEFAVTLFASFVFNAPVALLNASYSDIEMHHAMNLSKPKVMFVSNQVVERMAKMKENNSFLNHIVSFDCASSNSKVLSFNDLLEKGRTASCGEFCAPSANRQEDVALIVCSSGTTGLPKGVQLTQNNVLSGVDPSEIDFSSFPLSELRILGVIPWFHVFGCLTVITSTVMGSTLVFFPQFIQHAFLPAIEKYRIMMITMVPPLMVFLAKHPDVEKYDLSSLKILFCGAAPLSKETIELLQNRVEVPIIRQAYGLSETTRGVVMQNDIYYKDGSVGGLKKGLYAKVIDPDTGKALGPNQPGELCFKGNFIMKGYIGDAKSTQTVIQDGWLHSGDIGYFDDDFEFFIVDRIKELIKYKGFQVPPAEIEALLLTNPKVKDAAVIGKPDEEAGELPLAFIVKQDNANLTEDEVIKFVADRTSPAKRLRGGVLFVDEIPKNPSGKILRRVLRDILKKKLKSKL